MTTQLQADHAKFHNDSYRPRYCQDCWPGYEIEQPRPLPPLDPEPVRSSLSGMRSLGEAIEELRKNWKWLNSDWQGPIEEIDRELLPWCRTCGGYRQLRADADSITDQNFGKLVQCHDCFETATLPKWMDRLWGELPELFKPWEWESFPVTTDAQAEILATAQEAIRDPRRPWVLLQGPSGRGKTGVAVCMCKMVMREQRRSAKLINAHALLTKLRSTYGSTNRLHESEEDVLASLRDIPFLVIDDLGQENETDWACSELYAVIDLRHNERRQTIITSNWPLTSQSGASLMSKLGTPVARRISEMTRDPRYRIDFTGLPYLSNAG